MTVQNLFSTLAGGAVRTRVVSFVTILLAVFALALIAASPAGAREPSPPKNCRTGVVDWNGVNKGRAFALCESGYGTYRVWARCNWSASTLYGAWVHSGGSPYSAVVCATSTHPRGIVMAYGIQKRDG